MSEPIPLHLLRLVSPSFPIGAFSYSRGLEAAVEAGWVQDRPSAQDWILGTIENIFSVLDGALFWRLIQALVIGDHHAFRHANAWLAASRESRELQLEDRRMAEALMTLLTELEVASVSAFSGIQLTYPAAFAISAHHWSIPPLAALHGLMWSSLEAQVSAAIRLVPLGHTDGQRILIEAVAVIERSATRASRIEDAEIGNLSAATAMASAWHEGQYSRLFRS